MRADLMASFACMLMSLFGVTSPGCLGQTANPADPKSVASEFGHALEAGDADTVVRLASDGKTNEEGIRAVVRVNAAMLKVRKAASDRFGPAGAEIAGAFDPHDSLAQKVAASPVKTEGDRAEIAVEGGRPIVLRKVDGSWRVDMTRMLSVAGAAPALARADEELARNISAGMYKSPQAALDALGAMLAKADANPIFGAPDDERKAARATAESFLRDLFAGDVKAAGGLCLAGATEDADIVTLAGVLSSYNKMGEEAVNRFGAQVAVFQPASSSMMRGVEADPVVISGDTASIFGLRPPIVMKRSGQKWKIDLAESRRQKDWAAVQRTAKPLRRAYDEVARDIKSGKLKSAEEAMRSLTEKLAAADSRPSTDH